MFTLWENIGQYEGFKGFLMKTVLLIMINLDSQIYIASLTPSLLGSMAPAYIVDRDQPDHSCRLI